MATILLNKDIRKFIKNIDEGKSFKECLQELFLDKCGQLGGEAAVKVLVWLMGKCVSPIAEIAQADTLPFMKLVDDMASWLNDEGYTTAARCITIIGSAAERAIIGASIGAEKGPGGAVTGAAIGAAYGFTRAFVYEGGENAAKCVASKIVDILEAPEDSPEDVWLKRAIFRPLDAILKPDSPPPSPPPLSAMIKPDNFPPSAPSTSILTPTIPPPTASPLDAVLKPAVSSPTASPLDAVLTPTIPASPLDAVLTPTIPPPIASPLDAVLNFSPSIASPTPSFSSPTQPVALAPWVRASTVFKPEFTVPTATPLQDLFPSSSFNTSFKFPW